MLATLVKPRVGILTAALVILASSSAQAFPPVIDGSISLSDGWLHLTEQGYAQPVFGGSPTASDQIGESAVFHSWDGFNNTDVGTSDNRGDVINVFVAFDNNFLYVGVAGPTAPFNNWFEQDSRARNDIGDLFLALDTNAAGPSGNLRAADGHRNFGGAKAVDFEGWTPSYVVGVQYVDNGGGGGGFANVESTGPGGSQLVGASQNNNSGGFLWGAGINNTSASYDTVNGNAGEFELRIPWSVLGLSGPPTSPLRLAAYITHNYGGSDVYDSGPGIGNLSVFEEIGDCPGDPDSGQLGSLAACDALGQPGGAFANSFPGANFVGNPLNGPVGHDDGIDSIGEYFSVVVPEPTTLALLGVAAVFGLRRQRR